MKDCPGGFHTPLLIPYTHTQLMLYRCNTANAILIMYVKTFSVVHRIDAFLQVIPAYNVIFFVEYYLQAGQTLLICMLQRIFTLGLINLPNSYRMLFRFLARET
jgi:hypothetical protein